MNHRSKIAISLIFASSIFGCGVKSTSETSQVKILPMTEIDSVSYAFGILNGKSFSTYMNGVDSSINKEQVLKGFSNALDGVSDSLYQANLEYFQKWVKDKEERKISQLKEKSKNFLEENKTKKGVIETKSGLQYSIIRDSQGEKPTPMDTVLVSYEGRLIDGTVFENSYNSGQDVELPLSQVIKGWTEGICLMPVGSKFQFAIPYSLAYGDRGAGNVIPPYSTLIFDIELKGIKKHSDISKSQLSDKKKNIKKKK